MRIVIVGLLIASAWIPGINTAYGEMICDQPVSSIPVATPEATAFPFTSFPADGGDLTIFAAASLTDAFTEIGNTLESEYPDLTITIETAGSQTLVTQLEEGASADVLATANLTTMQRAQEGGLIHGNPEMFTGNKLVIVTPASNPAGIEHIDDLAGDDVRLVLANPDVPAGGYSMLAFCDYAAREDAPADFMDGVNANIASEEPDVRHVLTRVQLGEADAGIVYASDAAASMISGVELNVIEFPQSISTNAQYPIAAIADGNIELANAFISFLLSDEGQDILARYGFE